MLSVVCCSVFGVCCCIVACGLLAVVCCLLLVGRWSLFVVCELLFVGGWCFLFGQGLFVVWLFVAFAVIVVY